MKPLRSLNRDRVSAVLLILLGIAIALQAVTYRLGTLTKMGPGFIPAFLGFVLVLVGLAIGVTAEKGDFGTAKTHHMEWRGWLCILGGVLAFVVLGKYGGLVPASFAAVFISAMGDKGNTWKSALLLAVAMSLAAVIIFHYGLHLQLDMFTWG
jgi:hypothetical protein